MSQLQYKGLKTIIYQLGIEADIRTIREIKEYSASSQTLPQTIVSGTKDFCNHILQVSYLERKWVPRDSQSWKWQARISEYDHTFASWKLLPSIPAYGYRCWQPQVSAGQRFNSLGVSELWQLPFESSPSQTYFPPGIMEEQLIIDIHKLWQKVCNWIPNTFLLYIFGSASKGISVEHMFICLFDSVFHTY